MVTIAVSRDDQLASDSDTRSSFFLREISSLMSLFGQSIGDSPSVYHFRSVPTKGHVRVLIVQESRCSIEAERRYAPWHISRCMCSPRNLLKLEY